MGPAGEGKGTLFSVILFGFGRRGSFVCFFGLVWFIVNAPCATDRHAVFYILYLHPEIVLDGTPSQSWGVHASVTEVAVVMLTRFVCLACLYWWVIRRDQLTEYLFFSLLWFVVRTIVDEELYYCLIYSFLCDGMVFALVIRGAVVPCPVVFPFFL